MKIEVICEEDINVPFMFFYFFFQVEITYILQNRFLREKKQKKIKHITWPLGHVIEYVEYVQVRFCSISFYLNIFYYKTIY